MKPAHALACLNALLSVVCLGLAVSHRHTTGLFVNEPPYGPHRRSAEINQQAAAAAACTLAALGAVLLETTHWASPCVFLLVHLALVPHATFFHSLLAFLFGTFTAEVATLPHAARALVTQAPVALLLWSTGTEASVVPTIAVGFMAALRLVVPLWLERGDKDDAETPPLYAFDAALAAAFMAVHAAVVDAS
jgi:hypothetical protein